MTISSVGPAVLPTAGSAESTANGSGGLGSLFAVILGAGADTDAETDAPAAETTAETAESAHPRTPDPVESAHPGTPDPVESAHPGTPAPVESAHPGTTDVGSPAGIVEMISAAQVMAAAQVVPVTPVLAAALALRAGTQTPTPTPVASTPTTTPIPGPAVQGPAVQGPAVQGATVPGMPVPGIPVLLGTDAPAFPSTTVLAGPPAGAPTGSTAVSAGDPVQPAVPSSAGPLAAHAVTEQAAAAAHPAASPTTGEQGPAAAADPAAELAAQLTGATTQQGARPDPGNPGRQQREAGAEPVNGLAGTQATTSTAAPQGVTGRQEAVTPAQVTGQVFPEVGRLVTRGDGTHRITLTLSPEALGEVKVVLTVRDGDVHVRMVGSELAQQALRAGAPELQRLLDLAGASSSQIVVGDQGTALDAGPHGGRGTDRETQDHRTAGTRDGDTSARDGSQGGPQQRPSTDPTATRGGTSTVTGTRTGVDVTM